MLQAVAVPRSLAEAHAALGDGARIMAGGTAVMPELNQGTDAFTRLVSLRHAGLGRGAVADGRARIGAAATLARPRGGAGARLPGAGAAGHRLADDPQHGDRGRQPLREAALRRPRGLPDRARRGRDASPTATGAAPGAGGDAGGRGRRPAARSSRQVGLRRCRPQDAFRFRKAGRKALNAAAIVTVAAVVDARTAARSPPAASRSAASARRRCGRRRPRRRWSAGRSTGRRPRRPGGGRSRTSTRSTMPMPAPGTGRG